MAMTMDLDKDRVTEMDTVTMVATKITMAIIVVMEAMEAMEAMETMETMVVAKETMIMGMGRIMA